MNNKFFKGTIVDGNSGQDGLEYVALAVIIDDVLDSVPAPGQLKEFLGLIKQSQVGSEVQVGAMKTMARMLHQRLSNRIMEIGGQAKIKAVLVNTMIIVLASLIIIGVPGISLFMSIGFF